MRGRTLQELVALSIFAVFMVGLFYLLGALVKTAAPLVGGSFEDFARGNGEVLLGGVVSFSVMVVFGAAILAKTIMDFRKKAER